MSPGHERVVAWLVAKDNKLGGPESVGIRRILREVFDCLAHHCQGVHIDTFGGGGGWTLAEDSGPFTDPVPLPASIWLFLSAVGTLGCILRRNDRRSSPA